MDRVYERRSRVNTFYLSLNSILLTGLAAFLSQAIAPQTNYPWILVAVSAGIIFCIIWRRAILSSKALIVAKYKIIHLLETRLPAKLYQVEWDIAKQGNSRYTPFSDIEAIVPLVFVSAYFDNGTLELSQPPVCGVRQPTNPKICGQGGNYHQ